MPSPPPVLGLGVIETFNKKFTKRFNSGFLTRVAPELPPLHTMSITRLVRHNEPRVRSTVTLCLITNKNTSEQSRDRGVNAPPLPTPNEIKQDAVGWRAVQTAENSPTNPRQPPIANTGLQQPTHVRVIPYEVL